MPEIISIVLLAFHWCLKMSVITGVILPAVVNENNFEQPLHVLKVAFFCIYGPIANFSQYFCGILRCNTGFQTFHCVLLCFSCSCHRRKIAVLLTCMCSSVDQFYSLQTIWENNYVCLNNYALSKQLYFIRLKLKKKTLWPIFMDGVQLPQG